MPVFLNAQSVGDYRSVKNGLWLDATSWEQLQALPNNWIPATVPPGLATPSITILSGDTITVDNAAFGNNITIESTGRLIINLPVTDEFQFSGNNVNFGDVNWIDGAISFSSSAVSITNHGVFTINDVAGNANILSPGTITNAPDGIFSFSTTFGIIINPVFNNQGTFMGTGSISFNNKFQNNGTISPGGPNNVGVLRFESSSTTLGAGSIIVIDIVNGTGEGTGHDLLFFNTDRPFSFSGANLTVNDHATAPIGTYTLIRTNDFSNNFSGPFLSSSIPSAYSAPVIAPTNVSISKLSITVPLIWGDFFVATNNGLPQLYWTTLQETKTKYFDIERSSDGVTFVSIGRVAANGNTSAPSAYHFLDKDSLVFSQYYYRLKEMDIDGHYTYSKTCSFKVPHLLEPFKMLNNVVADNLELVTKIKTKIVVIDMNGKILMSILLMPGQHQINLSSLPTGVYNAGFSNKDGQLIVKRFVKM
ncbi:T9SS type A sorting domain-containing protein [Chitinophagaceae bacterium 26-R-25]|nr:T9SS type A sorting domain-containing protein [Chitinophagaceae bacterium 26-R-25]